jgi:predicted RNase H-like HicB family nuclease
MKYPVLITNQSLDDKYELSVVDLPGCKTEAKTVDEGLRNLENVVDSHLTILSEYGEKIPHAKAIDYHMKLNSLGVWVIVDIDIMPYLGKSQKINVTLPELLIKQIDDRVSKSSEHKTRSGFIASVCVNELAKG